MPSALSRSVRRLRVPRSRASTSWGEPSHGAVDAVLLPDGGAGAGGTGVDRTHVPGMPTGPALRRSRTVCRVRHVRGMPEGGVSLEAQVDDALAAELLRRAAEDQAARERYMEAGDADAMGRVDAENTAWLQAVVAEHGWPGAALVGEEAAHCAWLLAQHADRAPQFQKQALALLEAAVAAGDAAQRELAYLTDRVLVADGQPQLYGTQYLDDADGGLRPRPVADPDWLDERRAAMGMESAADYDRRMRETYRGRR